MRTLLCAFLSVALYPAVLPALGPHEVLVLVNGESRDSKTVGSAFVRLRGVPEQNVVPVSVPEKAFKPPYKVTPDEFTRLIWEPACAAARERGIEDHVLAWVYSVDFPIRVAADPPLSVQGLTFLRNRLPKADLVRAGRYVSPLFSGPNYPRGAAVRSQSLDSCRELLGPKMPLPSMMLGFTGENGSATDTVIKCLERGVQSDGMFPNGTVYFVTNSNIRSTARDWQFPGAVQALEHLGVKAVIVPEMPREQQSVLGVMAGTAVVDFGGGNVYVPGSLGEHLTSFAACFDTPSQTKLTAWIDAGAVASAGTVCEPQAFWTKFPNGWLFVHYASGCCVLESFYQSLRCPLQTLVVGDPLAQPWAPRGRVTVSGLGEGDVSGTVELETAATAPDVHYTRFAYLLDGRVIGGGKRFSMDTRKYANGKHVLRAVAKRAGWVKSEAFLDRDIVINNPGRGRGPAPGGADAGVMDLISQP